MLGKLEADWPNVGRYAYGVGVGGMLEYADIVSKTGWPAEHTGLSDFALRFLEADVMLFRSGYIKRHLLRRLRNAKLTNEQVGRAKFLVKRAVDDGAGLEEFREYCRLAAIVVDDELRVWLETNAKSAVLTLDECGPDRMWLMLNYDEASLLKLMRNQTYGLNSDLSLPLVALSEVPDDNRIKRNAWRMLRQIKRTQAARPKASRSPT